MATYELSISTKYVPNWGIKEGVREIMQNAIDANARGFDMSFKYLPESQTLKVHNKSAFLSPSSLLMGETEKAGVGDQIGEFGEGYKLGTLALLRAGKQVTIFNRCAEVPQRWNTSIEYSDKYDARVVVVKSTKINPQDKSNLTFQIKGITPEEWEECKKIFLEWGSYGSYESYNTPQGDVLYGDNIKGCLFVGGIFIEHNKDLVYGYNFNPASVTLNRDRQTITGWSLEYTTGRMWNHLGDSDMEHLVAVEGMLMNNAPDVRQMSDDYVGTSTLVEKLAERFQERHGEEAHPVNSVEEANSLSFSNIVAVPTGDAYTKVLERKFGTATSVVQEKAKQPIEEIPTYELKEDEQRNLGLALGLIQREDVTPFNVKVVNFHGDTLGRCKQSESLILVARKVLKSLEETLTVLVHEYSHVAGHDGEASFHWAERQLWAKITMRLLEEKNISV